MTTGEQTVIIVIAIWLFAGGGVAWLSGHMFSIVIVILIALASLMLLGAVRAIFRLIIWATDYVIEKGAGRPNA